MTLSRQVKPKYENGNIIYFILSAYYEIIQFDTTPREFNTYIVKMVKMAMFSNMITNDKTYVFSQKFVEQNSELVAHNLDSFKAQLL